MNSVRESARFGFELLSKTLSLSLLTNSYLRLSHVGVFTGLLFCGLTSGVTLLVCLHPFLVLIREALDRSR
ncbi:hypothetical protein AOLI_G00108710 [Acnodon oligacanthus]